MIKRIGLIIVLAIIILVVGKQTDLFKEKDVQVNNSSIEIVESSNVDIIDEVLVIDQEEVINNNEQEIKIMKAILKTNKGDIEIELDNQAPKTVENFVKLSEEGFYNETKFHRVIKGFMIQGGDPLSKNDDLMDRWGTGGPGYQIDDEIHSDNSNIIGSISMANSGPNTNGSQFFINTANNSFLNSKHTVFGNVVSGMDIVTLIEDTETHPDDKPVEAVIIKSIEIK